jgi:hypothetical protein
MEVDAMQFRFNGDHFASLFAKIKVKTIKVLGPTNLNFNIFFLLDNTTMACQSS